MVEKFLEEASLLCKKARLGPRTCKSAAIALLSSSIASASFKMFCYCSSSIGAVAFVHPAFISSRSMRV
jgi:hypothetical protein